MDTVWIIVISVFTIVGLAFFVGRKSKEHDDEMEKFLAEQETKDKAAEIEKSTTNLSGDAVRNELRNKLSK
jgi:hypothetical protein